MIPWSAGAGWTIRRGRRICRRFKDCCWDRRNFREDSLGAAMTTRRIFLRNSALTVVGTAAVPSFLRRAAFGAEQPGARTKRLVVVFQRGAADGLNIVVPHGEAAYYAMRPSINIARSSLLDLDSFFGLHPSLAPLLPLWNQ